MVGISTAELESCEDLIRFEHPYVKQEPVVDMPALAAVSTSCPPRSNAMTNPAKAALSTKDVDSRNSPNEKPSDKYSSLNKLPLGRPATQRVNVVRVNQPLQLKQVPSGKGTSINPPVTVKIVGSASKPQKSNVIHVVKCDNATKLQQQRREVIVTPQNDELIGEQRQVASGEVNLDSLDELLLSTSDWLNNQITLPTATASSADVSLKAEQQQEQATLATAYRKRKMQPAQVETGEAKRRVGSSVAQTFDQQLSPLLHHQAVSSIASDCEDFLSATDLSSPELSPELPHSFDPFDVLNSAMLSTSGNTEDFKAASTGSPPASPSDSLTSLFDPPLSDASGDDFWNGSFNQLFPDLV